MTSLDCDARPLPSRPSGSGMLLRVAYRISWPRLTLLILLSLMTAAPTQAGEETVKIAGLDVTIWSRDPGPKNEPQPAIVFSHGFHGCSTQSRFLMEAFAGAGYLVFAPNHRDATCQGGEATWAGKPDLPFQQARAWDDSSYRDRGDDIRRLLAALRTDDRFRARVDWNRVGLAGHSLGGYTVLGLGGAWASWKLAGIKAVLALSPYAQPFDQHHTLSGLSVPVMYQGGTRDFGITPALHKSMGTYDLSPEPKYYVEFDRAGHFAWTNISTTAHDSIVGYSLAFMNHYVKGQPARPALPRKLADVALYRYASELPNSGPPPHPGPLLHRGRHTDRVTQRHP